MAEPPTKEERERAWWDAWRQADYSWTGLADKPIGRNGDTIHGGWRGERTLQDYWRRDPATGDIRDDRALCDAGELIDDPDGQTWHIVHVPLTWQDESPAKADWDDGLIARQEALIAERLLEARETTTDWGCCAAAPDGRAQLAGAILNHPPALAEHWASPLHLVCDQTRIPTWDARGQTFGPGARFHGVFFAGDASFNSFAGDVGFHSASFAGHARFHSVSFVGYANFHSASFAGYADFHSVSFAEHTNFDRASFVGNARFDSASFAVYTSFDGASFAGDARFDRTSFAGYAFFDGVFFAGEASFDSASFARAAHFGRASFAGDALFDGASFAQDASFSFASFAGYAFFEASFAQDTSFSSASFAGAARFDNASFARHFDFTRSVFRKSASFERITWPRDAHGWHAAFEQAVFEDWAVFEGAGFKGLAAFADAVFKLGLKFDEVSEHEARKRFKVERAGALAAARADCTDPAGRVKGDLRAARLRRLKELERGCRVLKQAMEKASHKTREQLFYRFELLARRRQPDISVSEWTASWLYALASDYGGSIARPLMLLLLVWCPGFAVLYWAWAALLGTRPPEAFWQALTFSASRAFPIGFWSGQTSSTSWLDQFFMSRNQEMDWLTGFLSHGAGWALAARLAATFETIGSGVLIFLAALAVRRRFQIN